MSIGGRGLNGVRAGVLTAAVLMIGAAPAEAGDPVKPGGQHRRVAANRTQATPAPPAVAGFDMAPAPGAAANRQTPPGSKASSKASSKPGATTSAETVYFADPRHAPVRVMRGAHDPAAPVAVRMPAPVAVPAQGPVQGSVPGQSVARVETLSFGAGIAAPVTVLRGIALAPPGLAVDNPAAGNLVAGNRVEKISFADPSLPAVTVMRGIASRAGFSSDLFDQANGGELDRIAFAVDGVESRHGADLRMWRPDFAGPQGPMQVSAAAAIDVGGGDRFDLHQNRKLGRAYLAQMFRRYGNWPDALAAYNWGPGNLDQWILGGRNAEKLPLETARYITRVLRDALITGRTAGL